MTGGPGASTILYRFLTAEVTNTVFLFCLKNKMMLFQTKEKARHMSAQSLHCLHQMPSLMTPNLGSGGSIEKSFLRTRQRKEGRVLFQRSIKIRMAKWTIPRADSKTLTLMRRAFSGMASCCHLNRILETQYGDCTANRNKTQTKQLSAKGGEMRHSKNYGGRKLLDAT